MHLKLGEKIRELRRSRGVTQEVLADKLGITAQAISRWEMGGAYPDMEVIPPIANFFGITIDELFGYDGEREARIDAIIKRVDEISVMTMSQTDSGLEKAIDESISLCRQGLAEFPGNERLTYKLGAVLVDAGYRRHGEWWDYDDGYLCHANESNEYWDEAIKLFESLVRTSGDTALTNDAVVKLVNLYACTGKSSEAKANAAKLPRIRDSREMWLAYAASGKDRFEANGEAAIELIYQFAETVIQIIISNKALFETDVAVGKVRGLIDVLGYLWDDGNFGYLHFYVSWLYLFLSRLQWERGYRDEAFESLYEALRHADAYDSVTDNAPYTATLIGGISCGCRGGGQEPMRRSLPDDWPVWSNPDYTTVKEEITADPRWDEWVRKTQE